MFRRILGSIVGTSMLMGMLLSILPAKPLQSATETEEVQIGCVYGSLELTADGYVTHMRGVTTPLSVDVTLGDRITVACQETPDFLGTVVVRQRDLEAYRSRQGSAPGSAGRPSATLRQTSRI